MVKEGIYDKKIAKKRVKKLRKKAINTEKLLDYKKALKYYKRSKKIADKWNLTNYSLTLSVKIFLLSKLYLRNHLKEHIKIINISEFSQEYKKAYESIQAASNITSKLDPHSLDKMGINIKNLEKKYKELRKILALKILMKFNNGQIYETPTTLSKAFELIDGFPTSIEIPDNFISFENGIDQKILFCHVLKNSWYIEISLLFKNLNSVILKFNYFTTNIVKIFILNFFRGFFIGDYLNKPENLNHYYQQSLLFIRKIKDGLQNYEKCQFCNNKILKIGQNKCEYCRIEFTYEDLLFPNIK